MPTWLRDRLKRLMDNSSAVPSLSHYFQYAKPLRPVAGPPLMFGSFLDAWRSGDYTTSFDCLYRYFDYTMRNRDRTFYQYALMNLAILQADFGCYGESVSAMLESVAVARENKDMTCLNFALNWLFHFGRVHPEARPGARVQQHTRQRQTEPGISPCQGPRDLQLGPVELCSAQRS